MDSFKVGDHIAFSNEGSRGVITHNMQGVITEIDDWNKRMTIELDKPIKYFTFSMCSEGITVSLVEDVDGN